MVDHTEMLAYEGGERFDYTGTIEGAPAWVDPGWVGADSEGNQILNVPKGDPNAQPYTTVIARSGDAILQSPEHLPDSEAHTFLVVAGVPAKVVDPPVTRAAEDEPKPLVGKTDKPEVKGKRASHNDD